MTCARSALWYPHTCIATDPVMIQIRANCLILFTVLICLLHLGVHAAEKPNIIILLADSQRVPMLISGPGIAKGRSKALVYLHDLFPTLSELAGAEAPVNIDGRGLAPVLSEKRPKSGIRWSRHTPTPNAPSARPVTNTVSRSTAPASIHWERRSRGVVRPSEMAGSICFPSTTRAGQSRSRVSSRHRKT